MSWLHSFQSKKAQLAEYSEASEGGKVHACAAVINGDYK